MDVVEVNDPEIYKISYISSQIDCNHCIIEQNLH